MHMFDDNEIKVTKHNEISESEGVQCAQPKREGTPKTFSFYLHCINDYEARSHCSTQQPKQCLFYIFHVLNKFTSLEQKIT